MHTLLYIVGISMLAVPSRAVAQQADTLDVLGRIGIHESRITDIGASMYANPALRQFQHSYSYTDVTAGYSGEKTGNAVCSSEGMGHNSVSFDADTYIRHKDATLWGGGGYVTGKRLSPVWNEVADAWLVYPYLTADAIGGDMHEETYHFSGGYSSYDGRLAWGAALGYTAGHYYRDVDPRPRNVTGRLDVSAGVAYRVAGKYLVALGADFMKYKQTGDIDFMSELGQATVYHLTGLGTDYVRFRGNGFNTHYDGERYGVQVNVAPEDGDGLSATLHLQRLTLETILNDMNKLPLNSIWHNSLKAELGYRHSGNTVWGVSAGCEMYRRHGKENIFGDAASSIYPQIGSVDMYADNAYMLSARGVVEHRFGHVMLSYEPMAGYSHRCQIYAAPAREWLVNNWSMTHSMKASTMLGGRWQGALEMAWAFRNPVSSHLTMGGIEDSEGQLVETVCSDFAYASSLQRSYIAKAAIRYAVNKNNALQLSLDYRHDCYAELTTGNSFCINAGVVF